MIAVPARHRGRAQGALPQGGRLQHALHRRML